MSRKCDSSSFNRVYSGREVEAMNWCVRKRQGHPEIKGEEEEREREKKRQQELQICTNSLTALLNVKIFTEKTICLSHVHTHTVTHSLCVHMFASSSSQTGTQSVTSPTLSFPAGGCRPWSPELHWRTHRSHEPGDPSSSAPPSSLSS